MRVDWAVTSTYVLPIAAALIVMFSDVNNLKDTKADKIDLIEAKSSLNEQLIRNTEAIKGLNETTKELKALLSDMRRNGNG